jgi:hypothetical protein
MTYLLHVTYPSGTVQTTVCASAFSRGLLVIAYAAHPVIVRLEDREAA